MGTKRFCLCIIALLFSVGSWAQFFRKPYVETITNARLEGITIASLDSVYKSAVHVDNSKAVFKTKKDSDSLISAYGRFLREFGAYLHKNNFSWEQPARCWNRIYFSPDGAVDYYLFDFKTPISDEKLAKFKELFRAFAATNKIGITAPVGFAQCSPVTYTDK